MTTSQRPCRFPLTLSSCTVITIVSSSSGWPTRRAGKRGANPALCLLLVQKNSAGVNSLRRMFGAARSAERNRGTLRPQPSQWQAADDSTTSINQQCLPRHRVASTPRRWRQLRTLRQMPNALPANLCELHGVGAKRHQSVALHCTRQLHRATIRGLR